MGSIRKELDKEIREKKKSMPRGGIAKKRPRRILTPYDLNPKSPEYRHGKVRVSYLPKCANPTCGEYFTKTDPRQIYCSRKCMEAVRMRNKRKRRIQRGVCSHCGGPMTGELKPDILYPRRPPRYCKKCQAYWRKLYKDKKII